MNLANPFIWLTKNHLPSLGHSSIDNRTSDKPSQLLIVARSGNLLARAAGNSGYPCVVIDAYGDKDTLAAALDYRCLKYIGERIDYESLIQQIGELESAYGTLPILWGSGWEASGHLLCALAVTRQVLGSQPHSLLRLSNPNWQKHLFMSLEHKGVSRALTKELKDEPQYAMLAMFTRHRIGSVLIKSRRRSGGHAVRRASAERFLPSSEYFQALLPGRSISALCLADGHQVRIVGWSEHFKLQHNPYWEYRHSAAVSIESLCPSPELLAFLRLAMKYLGLFGIFGCDFVRTLDDQLKLVDLNPRVTATAPLHIAEDELIDLHLSPVKGIEKQSSAAASAIVYADIPIRITKTLDWPLWVSDLPTEARVYHSAEPVCTIHCRAENAEAAKSLLIERFNELMALLQQAR